MTKRCLMTMVAVMTLTMAGAQTVTPQACEQSIVTPKDNGSPLLKGRCRLSSAVRCRWNRTCAWPVSRWTIM